MATAVAVLPPDSAPGYQLDEPVLQVLTSQKYHKLDSLQQLSWKAGLVQLLNLFTVLVNF